MTTTTPDIATHRIFRDKLTALDLRAAQEEAFAAGLDVAAYRVEVEDYAQGGELLIAGDRAGFAWGADAVWLDVLPGETPEGIVRRAMEPVS